MLKKKGARRGLRQRQIVKIVEINVRAIILRQMCEQCAFPNLSHTAHQDNLEVFRELHNFFLGRSGKIHDDPPETLLLGKILSLTMGKSDSQ